LVAATFYSKREHEGNRRETRGGIVFEEAGPKKKDQHSKEGIQNKKEEKLRGETTGRNFPEGREAEGTRLGACQRQRSTSEEN